MIDIGNAELLGAFSATGIAIAALFARTVKSDNERHLSEIDCRSELSRTKNLIIEIQQAQIQNQQDLLLMLGEKKQDQESSR